MCGTTSFAYDYEGRVTSVTYPSTSSDTFGYNGLGARASTSGTNGSRTFLRNGLGVTSPVLEDGNADYTPGVSRRASSTTTFAHAGLKNTSTQTTENETVAASRVYDAFGNVVSFSGTWSGPFGYAGSYGYQEDPSGLRLLGHRYYESSTGRFLKPDPIGDGRNWYAYCDGSPVAWSDADGLQMIALLPFLGSGQDPKRVAKGVERALAAVDAAEALPLGSEPKDCKMMLNKFYDGIMPMPVNCDLYWTWAKDYDDYFEEHPEWVEIVFSEANMQPGDAITIDRGAGNNGHVMMVGRNETIFDSAYSSNPANARGLTVRDIDGPGAHRERNVMKRLWRSCPLTAVNIKLY